MSLDHAIMLLEQYKYFILFPLAVFEGPLIGIIAGFLVSIHKLGWFDVFAVLTLGDVAGDALYYAVGRYGGRRFVKRWGKYIGVKEERLEKMEIYFKKNDWKVLFFGKTQAAGSLILILAGIVEMNFWGFIWYNTLGTIPKVLLFEVAGFFIGKGYTSANTYLDYAGIGSFLIAVVLLGGYWAYVRYYKKPL